MVYYLADGAPWRKQVIEAMPITEAYQWWYIRRVQALNEGIAGLNV